MTTPIAFVKISRKTFRVDGGDPFWLERRDYSKWEAWIDVVQLAAWRASSYSTSRGVVALDRGEFVASLRHLAERWGWSVKRVRTWLLAVTEMGRVRAQRGHDSGTVYLIVNYDTYQSNGHTEGTATGTKEAGSGHKIEEVKEPKKKKTPAASASEHKGLDKLSLEVCNATHAKWIDRIGGIEYPRFRKALLKYFGSKPNAFGVEDMQNAIEAFADGMEADNPSYRDKWNPEKFAGTLPEWVRLGKMEYMDGWSNLTERGRLAKLFVE